MTLAFTSSLSIVLINILKSLLHNELQYYQYLLQALAYRRGRSFLHSRGTDLAYANRINIDKYYIYIARH
jgi:hypothetical protein